jgi:LysR family carnitine catabolism transcriptional activator
MMGGIQADMNVTIKHLRAFVELAHCKSYATASNRLSISQPAISICIKNLEAQVGGALFNRSTRIVELSPEGEAFFPKAKKLLNDWQDTFEEVHELFALKQGRLTVAAMPSFAASVLPSVLKLFSFEYPRIRIDVKDVVMESVVASVLDGEADLGIVFEPDNLAELHFQPLLKNQFIVVASDPGVIVNKTAITLADIAQNPIVMMNRGSSIRQWLEDAFQQNNLMPLISAEAWQLDTLGEMVKAGLGIAIVPELCKPQMQSKGLTFSMLENESLNRNVGVIYKQKSGLSVPASEFLTLLVERFK